MEWQIIVVLAVIAPVILLPAAYTWYITTGGLIKLARQAAAKKAKTQLVHPLHAA